MFIYVYNIEVYLDYSLGGTGDHGIGGVHIRGHQRNVGRRVLFSQLLVGRVLLVGTCGWKSYNLVAIRRMERALAETVDMVPWESDWIFFVEDLGMEFFSGCWRDDG